MSYTKMTALPLNYIKFYYTFAEMLVRAELDTQYRAKIIKDQGGNTLIDDYAISDDEDDFVNRQVNDAIYKVSERLIELNDELVLAGTGAVYVSETQVGVCVIDHDRYNDNILTVIDKIMEVAINDYVLMMWYEKCAMPEEFKINLAKFEQELNVLTEKIWQLRIPDFSATPDEISSVYGTAVEVMEGVTISGTGAEQEISFPEDTDIDSDDYVVYGYDSTGASIPGFDDLITERTETGFTISSLIEYLNATLVIIGATSTSSSNIVTDVFVIEDVVAETAKIVPHSIGSTTYVVQAIQADGTNVPGFDNMITVRRSTYFEFTSLLDYESLTILIIGVA